MECPRRCTFVAIAVYLLIKDNAVCQDASPENIRECSKLLGIHSSTELLNSILATAATNGVLPDWLPIIQGPQMVDNVQRLPYPQEILTKPLSVVPMPSGINPQEPIIFSAQPVRSPASNQNVLVATPMPCGLGSPSTALPSPAVPQSIPPPPLPQPNCISQITHSLPLDNHPVCAPNAGGFRPPPIMLQPENQLDAYPYSCYNQFAEPTPLPEINRNPGLEIFPPMPCSGPLDIIPNLGPQSLPQPTVFTTDDLQMPLQISVPISNIPAPRLTVVAANPSNSPVSMPMPLPEYPVIAPQFPYPPQLPIILEGSSKSSWRNLLPLILLALFSDRGCSSGGGCCCCCSCNGGSGSNIPIPYPIPIPVNNPIINTYTYPSSSRSREKDKDDEDCEDDSEDWKKK